MDADVLIHNTTHRVGDRATHPIELGNGTLAAVSRVVVTLAGRTRACKHCLFRRQAAWQHGCLKALPICLLTHGLVAHLGESNCFSWVQKELADELQAGVALNVVTSCPH
jgi:hypothetical protein